MFPAGIELCLLCAEERQLLWLSKATHLHVHSTCHQHVLEGTVVQVLVSPHWYQVHTPPAQKGSFPLNQEAAFH